MKLRETGTRTTAGRLAAMPLRVVALPTGRVQVHPRQTRAVGPDALRPLAVVAERTFTEPLPVLSWAVVHPDGLVVVDAGQAPNFAAPWWDVYTRTAVRFHVAPEDALPARLREAGLDPDDVRLHVLTHLHVDHVGFAGALPAARLVCTADEAAAAARPGARLRGYLRVAGAEGVAVEDEGVGPFERSRRLTADGTVRLLPTPGHTAGHASVLVDDGEGPRVLLAGDAVYGHEQLQAGWIDGVAAHAGQARASIARLRELCARAPTVVLPTHDPASARRLAARTPTVTA